MSADWRGEMADRTCARYDALSRGLVRVLGIVVLILSSLTDAYAVNPVQAGKPFARKPIYSRPHTIPQPVNTSLATCTRRGLAGSNDIRWNISGLLRQAVAERRIDEIQELALKQRYSAFSGRGDFALMECLKVHSCDLDSFSDLAMAVGQNQLHLQHAARCNGCNKINVFKLSGNTVEGLMDSFYQRGGWEKLEGEIGNSGIDGLYYKVNPSGQLVDVLVTEAKYNESILQETRSGTQMSKQWILDNLARLVNQAVLDNRPELARYREVTRFVQQDVYRAQLWHMNVDDDRLFIWRERISSKGRTVTPDPILDEHPWNPGAVHEIDMLNAASNFDRQILSDYEFILSRTIQNPAKLIN